MITEEKRKIAVTREELVLIFGYSYEAACILADQGNEEYTEKQLLWFAKRVGAAEDKVRRHYNLSDNTYVDIALTINKKDWDTFLQKCEGLKIEPADAFRACVVAFGEGAITV